MPIKINYERYYHRHHMFADNDDDASDEQDPACFRRNDGDDILASCPCAGLVFIALGAHN